MAKKKPKAAAKPKPKTGGKKVPPASKAPVQPSQPPPTRNKGGRPRSSPVHLLSEEQIESLLKSTFGNISEAAKIAGLPRQTLADRVFSSPRLTATWDGVEEGKVDGVESALYIAAMRGSVRAMELFLTRSPRARQRGWGRGDGGSDGTTVATHYHAHVHTSNTGGADDVDKAIASASLENLKLVESRLAQFAADDEGRNPIVLEASDYATVRESPFEAEAQDADGSSTGEAGST